MKSGGYPPTSQPSSEFTLSPHGPRRKTLGSGELSVSLALLETTCPSLQTQPPRKAISWGQRLSLTSTFLSLMSRWTSPWLCRKRIPSTTSRAICKRLSRVRPALGDNRVSLHQQTPGNAPEPCRNRGRDQPQRACEERETTEGRRGEEEQVLQAGRQPPVRAGEVQAHH